jgi:penicillin-binding protein 1A
VLERLRETGLATRASVSAAQSRDLGLVSTAERRVHAPEVERAVWRALGDVDPDTDWRRGGRLVESTVDLVRQQHARQALAAHLHALDERQGWRGALGEATDVEAFRAAWREAYGDASLADPTPELVPAIVTDVRADGVQVWAGETRALEAWRWAVPYREDADNHGEVLDDARDALSVGDVVLVDAGGHLRQFPRVEGAFASLDLATGDIEALVGQYDADRSAFDRVVQGCRQPGSTFKPVVYSAALDAGYTVATLLRDGPLRMELGPNEEWRPRNADGDFSGHVTLWHAFVTSRNLAALAVADDIGDARVIRRARDLGLTTPLDAVESLALGASCVRPVELLEVYATLARSGFRATPRVVRAVDGRPQADSLRDDEDVANTRALLVDPAQRAAALWAMRDHVDAPSVTQANGYIMAWLLSEVARAGTAAGTDLPFPFAGKTGTTNAFDAWFAGFTSEDASVLWIGSDVNTRPLGRRENGSRLALPAWADAQLPPDGDTPLLPLPPTGITWVPVDLESGELAPPDRPSLDMPFVAGTEPERVALTQERRDRVSLERLERDF